MKSVVLGFASLALCAVGCADLPENGTGQTASELRITSAGSVYSLDNDPAANGVVIYRRAEDGRLSPSARVLTGGRGSGNGLGSQGAVILSPDHRRLFAVNAGSNEVSSFRVSGDALTLVSIVPSGGVRPVSLALHDDLLYALNADGAGSVSGFTVDRSGELTPLPRSTRPLSGGAAVGPAQVAFNPEGDALVVTEKGTNSIDTYEVRRNGELSAPRTTASAGPTPFGFAFSRDGVMVVSEAAGGAAGMGSASSYRLDRRALPEVITGVLHDGQGAPCWVAIPRSGDLAYVTNTASDDITAFEIGRRGRLSLHGPTGVVASTGAGSAPADIAITDDQDFVYVLHSGNGAVSAFRADGRGGLTPLGDVGGLPAHPAGLAVR
jgi:6-phosphogluconolactonase